MTHIFTIFGRRPPHWRRGRIFIRPSNLTPYLSLTLTLTLTLYLPLTLTPYLSLSLTLSHSGKNQKAITIASWPK